MTFDFHAIDDFFRAPYGNMNHLIIASQRGARGSSTKQQGEANV
jgi:hypothetical protein